MEINYKVAEEIALVDVKAFVEYHKEKPYTDEKISDDYDDLVEAVKLGTLVISAEMVPTYALRKSVLNTAGGVALSELTFKTRIRASEQERLSMGLNEKQSAKYINLLKGFFMQQPVAMLDKLDSKFDLRVIDQLCQVFM